MEQLEDLSTHLIYDPLETQYEGVSKSLYHKRMTTEEFKSLRGALRKKVNWGRPAYEGLNIRGKLGDFVYAAVTEGNANAAAPLDPRRQKRRYVVIPNPKTPAQLIQQDRMRRANAAWIALPQAEKDVYNEAHKGLSHYNTRGRKQFFIHGRNYFVSIMMLAETNKIKADKNKAKIAESRKDWIWAEEFPGLNW